MYKRQHNTHIDPKTAATAPTNPDNPIALILPPSLFAVALAEALVVAVAVDDAVEAEVAGADELLPALATIPPSTFDGSLLTLTPAAAER